MRTFLLAIAAVGTVCAYLQAAQPSKKDHKEIQAAVTKAHKELGHYSTVKGIQPAEDVEATFATPDVCGKSFTTAEIITTGIRVVLSGKAQVKPTAETGTYKFYTYFKVVDQAGNVVREGFSSFDLLKGSTHDFGYIDVVQKCYCDATKLKIKSSISSISPSGKFRVHHYEECNVQILARNDSGGPEPTPVTQPTPTGANVKMLNAERGVIEVSTTSTTASTDYYEVKSIWLETKFNVSYKSAGDDAATDNRFTVIMSPLKDEAVGTFWTNRTAEEAEAIMEVFENAKANGKPLYYFYKNDTLGTLGL